MFYIRINKVKILNNRELLGKGEIQLMSFITGAEQDFPMLQQFFVTQSEAEKIAIVKDAAMKILSSRILLPIQKVKDNASLYFGDTGYIVFKSPVIPDDFSWMLLAIEKDSRTRETGTLISTILTDSNLGTIAGALGQVAGFSNPVAASVSILMNQLVNISTALFKADCDDLAGMLLTSFIRREHYPHGIRDKQDTIDLTGNMYVDYSIFGFEETTIS
ncbi:MAG TPA: hypothetical protein DCR43_00065 [Bacteroidales bacterium]|nr:MAG: hypothetical protein A2X11_04620 [Bacteroidetes bacterium GWE2_42_24]OFY27692.1 MAG: hypothetical protein A2X09_10860 [Bacteroidetes bacterium GWF2_43_11]HAQ64247.1 hypothetical protein [Bacteroidales bacterium]HBZ66542.1 hypothetical protein [Bacteroidales bacterium]